jgi:rhamnopyranosyl-N-acetylglucosaminyl-diphospho-decaprenol beta-1,3/1,4-galactofuranosyltransferase
VEVALLGAVLVTYRRPSHLQRSLVALARQTIRPHHLVVVDNGRDPCLRALAESYSATTGTNIGFIEPPENIGPAGGFALGVAGLSRDLADDDWILLLDDDDPLGHSTVLERLLTSRQLLLDEGIRLGGIAMKGARFDLRRLRTHSITGMRRGLIEVDHLHGGFAPIYLNAALRGAGGFRSELFWGFEELDVGLRIYRAGWRLFADTSVLGSLGHSLKVQAISDRPHFSVEGWSSRRYYKLRNLISISRQHCAGSDIVRTIILRCLVKPIANLLIHPRRAWGELRCNLLALLHAYTGTLGRTIDL